MYVMDTRIRWSTNGHDPVGPFGTTDCVQRGFSSELDYIVSHSDRMMFALDAVGEKKLRWFDQWSVAPNIDDRYADEIVPIGNLEDILIAGGGLYDRYELLLTQLLKRKRRP